MGFHLMNPKSKSEELRWKLRLARENVNRLKLNITKEETMAINTLQNANDNIICPADKGNTTVVMSKFEYTVNC